MLPLPWTLPGRMLGVDVSSAQYPSSALMQSAKAAGAVACDVKGCDYDVSRATPFMDPRMIAHLQFAKSVGFRTGIYGFFKSGHPWQVQAEQYLRCLDMAGLQSMRPTIDWEDSTRIIGAPQASLDGVLHWCEFVHVRSGRAPQVYCPPSVLDILARAKVDASGLLAYDWWAAHYRWDPATGRDYGLAAPRVVTLGGKPWTPVAWQCGGNGAPRFQSVDGWSPVDLDLDVLYFGTLADFDAHNASPTNARDTDPAPPPVDAIDIGKHDGDWTTMTATTALASVFAATDSQEPITEPGTPEGHRKSSQRLSAVVAPILGVDNK